MEKSQDCQPLGIAIAQRASDLGIPFVLVTSTFHHDRLTQPIYEYAERKGWSLIDNVRAEKETVEFWEGGFSSLEKRLGKG